MTSNYILRHICYRNNNYLKEKQIQLVRRFSTSLSKQHFNLVHWTKPKTFIMGITISRKKACGATCGGDRQGFSMRYQNYPAASNYPVFTAPDCMLSKHLTKEVYENLYKKVTPNGITLDKVIQPGVENVQGTIFGLIAGDEESYEVFKDIFDPMIEEKHLGFTKDDKHPAPELEPSKLTSGELDDTYVKSCRIRTGRSIKGICFPPSMCRAERREVERSLSTALEGLTGDLKGKYYSLATMNKADEQKLIDDHFLFQKPTGHLMTNSTAVRDWPDARGIWHNEQKNFLVWVNEEDHCRVISMQNGGSMQKTFERFCRGLQEVESLMKTNGHQFMWNERLGYICACPTNIGTGLRCSVHVQLHNLCKHPKFDAIVKALDLQKRGTAGEHTAAVDDIYDLSNFARLKKTEREFVQVVIDGVLKIIHLEKTLAKGGSIETMLPKGC